MSWKTSDEHPPTLLQTLRIRKEGYFLYRLYIFNDSRGVHWYDCIGELVQKKYFNAIIDQQNLKSFRKIQIFQWSARIVWHSFATLLYFILKVKTYWIQCEVKTRRRLLDLCANIRYIFQNIDFIFRWIANCFQFLEKMISNEIPGNVKHMQNSCEQTYFVNLCAVVFTVKMLQHLRLMSQLLCSNLFSGNKYT